MNQLVTAQPRPDRTSKQETINGWAWVSSVSQLGKSWLLHSRCHCDNFTSLCSQHSSPYSLLSTYSLLSVSELAGPLHHPPAVTPLDDWQPPLQVGGRREAAPPAIFPQPWLTSQKRISIRTGNGLIINEPGQWQRSVDGVESGCVPCAALLHMATAAAHVWSCWTPLVDNWNYEQLLDQVVGRQLALSTWINMYVLSYLFRTRKSPRWLLDQEETTTIVIF